MEILQMIANRNELETQSTLYSKVATRGLFNTLGKWDTTDNQNNMFMIIADRDLSLDPWFDMSEFTNKLMSSAKDCVIDLGEYDGKDADEVGVVFTHQDGRIPTSQYPNTTLNSYNDIKSFKHKYFNERCLVDMSNSVVPVSLTKRDITTDNNKPMWWMTKETHDKIVTNDLDRINDESYIWEKYKDELFDLDYVYGGIIYSDEHFREVSKLLPELNCSYVHDTHIRVIRVDEEKLHFGESSPNVLAFGAFDVDLHTQYLSTPSETLECELKYTLPRTKLNVLKNGEAKYAFIFRMYTYSNYNLRSVIRVDISDLANATNEEVILTNTTFDTSVENFVESCNVSVKYKVADKEA